MTCPSPDQLLALLTGAAADPELNTHLDDCPACQRELERLTADADSLGGGLRQPALRPTAATAVVSVLGRLQEDRSTFEWTGPAADEETPEVPGYEILALLGRGGQGAVYKARDLSLPRVVALKVLGQMGPDDEPRRARFRREVETLAKLRHPNIVQIYEVGEAGGRPHFTMEYVTGGCLAATLTGTPRPPRAAAALVRVLADAVHAAHAAGVVHRDLKPGNVLMAGSATPQAAEADIKITDFGLAKSFESSFDLTHSGMLIGTPTYMAPEQVQCRADAVGPATDVHALGAILYQLLTGRAPFQGAELMDLLSQVAHAEPLPPRRLLPGLPRDLDTVCLKCLEPARRISSPSVSDSESTGWPSGSHLADRPGRGRASCRRSRYHENGTSPRFFAPE